MYGYIYKTTNLINGKIYIGQKKSSVFLEEKYLGSGKHLKRAVLLYGKENFKVEMLDTSETKKELDDKEIYWISYYNATDNTIGYNISNGGNDYRSMSGKNNPMYGNEYTDEECQEISKQRNTSGYFRVYKLHCKKCKQGFTWAYRYYDKISKTRKVITSIYLTELEKKVKSLGLLWVKFDN